MISRSRVWTFNVQTPTIHYGSQTLTCPLPDRWAIQTVQPNIKKPERRPQDLITRSLRNPTDSPLLRDIARGKRTAVILVPGKTRVAAARHYLLPLIAELNAGGIDTVNIDVVLATGTHERHQEQDVINVIGPDVADQVQCHGHDCKNEAELTDLGSTGNGTPVRISRRVLNADVKVLTGRIVHHYFAGFSGGRKALVPGTAGFQTILANHRLTLGPDCGIHPAVRPGSLDHNPVHLDMIEAARTASPDFCLNTLLDTEDRLVDVVSGHWEKAHEAGCRTAARLFTCPIDSPVDAVITSPGGNPHDCNFIQSIKALFNVQDIIRAGAKILWVAQCRGGILPGFLNWADIKDDDELESGVRERYNLAGHNSIMLRRLLRQAQVALFSELPPDQVRKLGIHPIAKIEQGLEWLTEGAPPDRKCAVVPHANVIHATLRFE